MNAGYSSRCSRVRTPAISPATAGMGERELDRGGTQWHAPPLAGFGEPPGAIDDLGARRVVVEAGARPRVGQHAAVHHPADEHRDASLDAQRQDLPSASWSSSVYRPATRKASISVSRANRTSIGD